MSAHSLELEMGDIVSRVCPQQEVTRYYCSKETDRDMPEKQVNAVVVDTEVTRLPEFPEYLWKLKGY